MDYRDILTIAVVAVLLVPVASAYAPSSNSAPGGDEQADDGAGAAAASSATTAQDGNYTRLYITDGYLSDRVKPGESVTFNVTVGNSEDHAVELDPHVVLPQVQGRPIEKSWITIEDADTTLDAGEEQQFAVTVEVPDDAEFGSYRAQVAFTNQTVSYPGRPDRPVHAAQISVSVHEEPSVQIVDGRYASAQVQTGDSYTYEVTVRNDGDQAVPLNPRIQMREHRRPSENTVERSWFEIDAPTEVQPGETATVTITVTPPEDASVGRYHTEVNLGLTDPKRPDRSDYWQRVDLSMLVWEQPDQPFEKTFSVSERADNVSLSLTAGNYYEQASDEPVSFDVTFVSPNGTEFSAERVSVTDSGSVSLGADDRHDAETQGAYAARSGGTEFEYRVDDPDAGEWTVRIMPRNTVDFRYQIVRNEG
ncbi:COG1470 family protein [Halosimplex amylolyticum]|uniref:COG1470 family protein n=1 Tax=Halosimplex amylolyticum TaxID=3396616 RepID=UPI003F5785B7